MSSAGSGHFIGFFDVVVVDAVTVFIGDKVDADLPAFRVDVSVASPLVTLRISLGYSRLARMRIAKVGLSVAILRVELASNVVLRWLSVPLAGNGQANKRIAATCSKKIE